MTRVFASRLTCLYWMISFSFMALWIIPSLAQQERPQERLKTYTFSDIKQCNFTSRQLNALGADVSIEPCVLYDIQPTTINSNSINSNNSSTLHSLVTSIQITPTNCAEHRDGAITAARTLNADNQGRGVAIGFDQSTFVQFRHVSIVAGNPAFLGTVEYSRRHVQLLEQLVMELDVQYIAGSCSFTAAIEKEPARRLQRMILTMVGPPSFYRDNGPQGTTGVNPYVFGIHINSDTYGKPAVQHLSFVQDGPQKIPIRVIYRKESEFFRSTCQAVLDYAQELGFADVEKVLYAHDEDHDGDGTLNQFDSDFLGLLADQICPPGHDPDFHPAIFACTLTEQDILLQKWRSNGCQPMSLWMTPSTWGWATDNPTVVPYFQGGGQWHPSFSYGDKYFDTGVDLLTFNEAVFGYRGNYDMVVSYAMVVLFSQHLQAAYRIFDAPDPMADFRTPEGYEKLRRDMIILNVETIFGTVSFNEFQRNEGREAAGTQWLPSTGSRGNETTALTSVIDNFLVSPLLQAQRAAFIPAPVARVCEAGQFDNVTRSNTEDALLVQKCSLCPVDTFSSKANFLHQCQRCPDGATTASLSGQTFCTIVKDNMLGPGFYALGNIGVFFTWVLAVYFAHWTFSHWKDPVVDIGQPEFLLTICIAAMISSSSVVFLGLEAGSNADDKLADLGCRITPFLYCAGWITEYSSLSVKTYRLFRITSNQSYQRIQIRCCSMFFFVLLLLAIDMALVTFMTIFTPLEYVREVTNRDISDNTVIINTSGRCSAGVDVWSFVGPIIALHLCLQLGTNWLLCKVRGVNDRYQEQKYVALASLFVLEVLVIGVPVLVAVDDSPDARYIVMASIVVLNDIGILCFVFLPKIKFQKQGLPEGVGVGESINRDSMRRAITRHSQRFALNTFTGQLAGTARGRPLTPRRVLASDSSGRTSLEEDNGGSGPFSKRSETTRSFVLGMLGKKSPEKAEDADMLTTRHSRSGAGARGPASASCNLESIVEGDSAEMGENDSAGLGASNPQAASTVRGNPLSSSFSVKAIVRNNDEASVSSSKNSGNNNTTNSYNHHSNKPSSYGKILLSDIQARVREKVARRLALVDQNTSLAKKAGNGKGITTITWKSPGVDENAAMAVGGSLRL